MTVFAADLAQDGGARTAVAIMESILLDIMFDLPGPEGVKEVVISRQLVEDTTPPLASTPTAPIVPATPGERLSERPRTSPRGIRAGCRVGAYHSRHRPRCSLPGPSPRAV